MRWAFLQQCEDVVEDFIKISASELSIAGTAGKRVVEIDVEVETLVALGRGNDAEACAKLRGIEVELAMAACGKTQTLGNGVKPVFKGTQHDGIVCIRRHRSLQRHAQEQKIRAEHMAEEYVVKDAIAVARWPRTESE